MKTLKKLTTTLVLSGVIIMGVQNAQAGIIVNLGDDTKTETCQDLPAKYDKKDWGIIVNLTGIIVNLTGIIVNLTGDSKSQPTDCGIIVN